MALTSTPKQLPSEVLSIICSELGADGDYVTLYNCAKACKSLADPALRTLYGIHEHSPAFKNEDVDMTSTAKTNTYPREVAAIAHAMKRQASVWRSIILSSQDEKTFKPYCVYIRTLDFRNLASMLGDFKFSDKIRKDFFAGAMARFKYEQAEDQKPTKKFQYLDVTSIINAVGDAIMAKTAHLEELSGHLDRRHLADWIRKTPHLKSLTLYYGGALSEEAGIAIRERADNFRDLTILDWRHPNADTSFGAFLFELRPHSLEVFAMISNNNLGMLSFDALGLHASSLKKLLLNSLTQDAVMNLHKLRACTAVETLSLEDNTRGQVHLEADHGDVFVEVVAWLSGCNALKDISFKNLFDGPAILARVLSSQAVKLERLSLEGYELRFDSATAFHTSLSDQQDLQTLELKGSCEDATPNHYSILVEALCNIPNLRELRLRDISDDFDEIHITQLAFGLPLLEDFWTSGQAIGPDVLPVLANMSNLKVLNLYALTQFGCTDILDFISKLDKEKQRGFNLNLMAQDADYSLAEDELELIREVLRSELDGKLDFVLWREEEWENSDDD